MHAADAWLRTRPKEYPLSQFGVARFPHGAEAESQMPDFWAKIRVFLSQWRLPSDAYSP